MKRCAWSQACRGEMEGMVLGPASQAPDLSSTPSPCVNAITFSSPSEPQFLHLANEVITAPPPRCGED